MHNLLREDHHIRKKIPCSPWVSYLVRLRLAHRRTVNFLTAQSCSWILCKELRIRITPSFPQR